MPNLKLQFNRLIELIRFVHLMASPCKGIFYSAGLLSIIVGVFDAIQMLIAVNIVVDVFGDTRVELPSSFSLVGDVIDSFANVGPLLSGVLIFALVTILRQATFAFANTLSYYASNIIVSHVRLEIIQNMMAVNFQFLDRIDGGKPRQIVTKESPAVITATRALITCTSHLASLSLLSILLVQLSLSLTLVIVGCAFALLPAKYLYSRIIHRLSQKNTDESVLLTRRFNEVLQALRTIKLQNRARSFIAQLRGISQRSEMANRNANILVVWEPVVIQLSVLCLLIGVFLFWTEHNASASSEVIAYFLMVYRLIPFFNGLNQAVSSLISVQPKVRLVESFMNDTSAEQELDLGSRELLKVNKIEFRDVNMSYSGDRSVLKNISFEARKGEVIAIVGKSGSGKSTIAHLLMRMYKRQSGDIFIDGISVDDIRLASLREKLGLVSQEPQILGVSIKDIIKADRGGVTDADAVELAKRFDVHDFVKDMADQYDTVLGESGSTISGGQRQRLFLTQVVARAPEILILDEATSGLDSKTERRVINQLLCMSEELITIVITHRVTNLRSVDQIIVMDNGEIVETGKWDDLVRAHDGYFRSFLDTQKHY